ncbi:MAG: serine/threonine transporter SstT, partial [Eggerthellaceae bacterium]|nr:serine/threonine transporter SstT [Eggerthellaceae bacterium]
MAVKDVVRKYNEVSLIKRILVGLVIGVLLALVVPVESDSEVLTGLSEFIVLLGSLFVSALKGVAPVLVFFLVISALCNAKTAGSMKTVVILYIVSTLVAALVAVIASYLFPTVLTLDTSSVVEQSSPEGIGAVLTTLVMNIACNPVDALMNANYIGILAWAVVLGIALRAAKQATKDVFTAVSDAVSMVVRWVISLAPFGILGLVYNSVATSGMEIFFEYGRIILVLVACMLVIALGTNALIVFACTKRNPYPLILRCLKDSGLTAFFTRSSAANIPVNMELCRKLGLDKDNYSVSIPLGATINMAGAAVTITIMTMAAAHTIGRSVDPVTAVILCVLAAVSACGASGVA